MAKSLFLSVLLSLFVCMSAVAQVNKEKRDITEFASVEAAKGVNISLVQCDKYELEVVTEGCPTSDVETSIKKGKLFVKMKKRTPGSAVQVFIYFKDLNSVTLKGGASVRTDCLFAHKGEFILDLGAQCEAEMEVEIEKLIVEANTSVLMMSGKADSQEVLMTGTLGNCSYDAESLYTKTTQIEVTGAEAVVRASESIEATAVGGKIKCLGGAKVTEKTSFGGEIIKE